ncbi:SAV_6107 family HEPN domain-containing protein [Pedococcus sp. 5OH_020]|uniref:SAV_6107 family HEPN domain-containing protein n=1 Tax=Pedococcus sp. 5OH_020 TaxID=2989814 RepID=UPI0022E9F50D|nr:SAV_6107 family HEPN domain-containing protein [Pedococcus sp. 5OH_020]
MTTATVALDLLDRSRHSLLEACHSSDIAQRYVQARLGALRAAAALVAARTTPDGRSGPRSLWDLLPSVAPELSEWARFFELVATRERHQLSAREADDLLRQSEVFVDLVCRSLGLPVHPSEHSEVLVPTTLSTAAS